MWNGILRLSALIAAAAVAGACTPSTGGQSPLSPLAPSLIAPSLEAASGTSSPLRAGGASYDATGLWNLVIADQRTGEVYEDVDNVLTQHPDGTVTFCGGCEGELFTLTPRGARKGAAVPYELSFFGEGEPCNASLSGAALLDTRTGVIRANGARGVSDDCSTFIVTLTLTRRAP